MAVSPAREPSQEPELPEQPKKETEYPEALSVQASDQSRAGNRKAATQTPPQQ
ncbi:hypothetical protein PJL18_00292 [Paenarthrobacter nicotinovorans]|nr:hypothetical protein [Paenarthrobacter nicotinovorans]